MLSDTLELVYILLLILIFIGGRQILKRLSQLETEVEDLKLQLALKKVADYQALPSPNKLISNHWIPRWLLKQLTRKICKQDFGNLKTKARIAWCGVA